MSLRCLALLSGGKDSVAAVDVARQHGWDVVGGLTMRPVQDDAWMFHTPNLDATRAVAQCLGLPLDEVPCRADAQEEVEDLERAVRALARRHGADALLNGALQSEYQRTRIDAVGHRVGIKTFAPLWHKHARHYLDGLLVAGWDIRFSRTAADGVDNAWAGERMEKAHLDQMARHPSRPHAAGEGGEYETLVLDAPCFGKRIVVEESRVEESASRATWVVTGWRLEEKG